MTGKESAASSTSCATIVPARRWGKGKSWRGVNPQASDRTRDASFVKALLEYFEHTGQSYTDILGRRQEGPDDNKPTFAYIAFEFPHTPVLPPAEYRKKFQELKYRLPALTKAELSSFPPQILKIFKRREPIISPKTKNTRWFSITTPIAHTGTP